MQAGTFAGMIWEYVSRFKAEVLSNLHKRASFGWFAPAGSESVVLTY
jgi:hypothetical protein